MGEPISIKLKLLSQTLIVSSTISEYKTQSLMLDIDYQLIIVKPFENGNSALKYLEAIKNTEELKELLGTSDYEHFITIFE